MLLQWDHVDFPGPLPRSFIPAIMLSLVVRPALWLAQWAVRGMAIASWTKASAGEPELDKFVVQIIGEFGLVQHLLLLSASLR